MPTEIKAPDTAVGYLERMRAMVDRDLLETGDYLHTDAGDSREVAHNGDAEVIALCGGHRVCAIGALWASAGLGEYGAEVERRWGWEVLDAEELAELKEEGFDGVIRENVVVKLYNAEPDNRYIELDNDPKLAAALDALNKAASDWYHKHKGEWDDEREEYTGDMPDLQLDDHYEDMIEALFEGSYRDGGPFGREQVLEIIDAAITKMGGAVHA